MKLGININYENKRRTAKRKKQKTITNIERKRKNG